MSNLYSLAKARVIRPDSTIMPKRIFFHRAIFLSWYCAKGDCAFCYMSTQKHRIKEPKLAKRSIESILAETIICKIFDWKIEFLSGGFESYKFIEFRNLIRNVHKIYRKKLWLNIGTLKESEINSLLPYIEGISGSVECINPKLRRKICPSKPIEAIERMFGLCDKYNLKKSITIILGLGETLHDFVHLRNFVQKHNINRITFYRLKPIPETIFEGSEPITKEYYASWVSASKQFFPKIEIIVGSWLSNLDEISLLLNSGADGITKFPSIRKFASSYAKQIENEVRNAGMEFRSNLTRKKKISIKAHLSKLPFDPNLKSRIEEKLTSYLKSTSH